MEIVQAGRRVCREMSPERGKVCGQTRMMKPTFKKVQVVYYLARNGHLEHPHYIEVTHLAHQPLLLRDVMDRLRVLRGKGMPSLYSWSCKRSYKNGYVWNDLSESDAIYPSEGAEYVLKGSQLIEDSSAEVVVEKLHHLQVGNGGQYSNFKPKRMSLASKRQLEAEEMVNNHYNHHDREDEENDEEYEEKTSYSRCSRGVSTDEIQEFKPQKNGPSQLSPEINSFSSPPSTTSSDTICNNNNNSNNNACKRFEDVDPVGDEPSISRNSLLLSLIACGGSASFRKVMPPPAAAQKQSPPPSAVARKSGGGNLHKGAVCKAAEEVKMMVGCMSENPRFGKLQAEEKEYFSGSILETIATEKLEVDPGLKKSSSHNEERSNMTGLGEAVQAEMMKKEEVKGKCIPRKKSSSKESKK